MPDDFNKYVISHSQILDSTFISKTSKGRQGKGIVLLKHPRDLGLKKIGENDDIVIQRYIDDPLLIDNKKHDLRLYLTILSVEPMIAYLNEEGLARFCTQDYQKPNQHNIDDPSIHLTNYSLNKHCENYEFSDEVCEENNGSKRTLKSYWKSVQAHRLDPDYVIRLFGPNSVG